MAEAVIRHDEFSVEDHLNRGHYTAALARMVESCETPLVIGLYGTWGIGKTSMMRHIQSALDANKVKTVWFDPWQQQFDDQPVLALLHAALRDLDETTREQLKGKLISLAAAFGSVALKALTSLDLMHIKKVVDEVGEERFLLRERQVRLREHFEAIIEAVRGQHQKRIVFFIDDLDRCLPPQILSLLEALKLYLNLNGCVYFLGLDRDPIEQSIRHHYSALELSEAEYLDKIIQLPFTIPPIAPEAMTDFVEPLLPDDLKSCCQTLVDGLAHNPRQVKRFINTLTLNHLLAAQLEIPDYDPRVLALLLMIQWRNRMLYRRLTREPAILIRLNAEGDAGDELRKQYFEGDPELPRILESLNLPDEATVARYIYLTTVARFEEARVVTPAARNVEEILREHALWNRSEGEEGRIADLSRADLSGANLPKARLREANLLEANLSGANLAGADLRAAKLSRADLRAAKLSRASLGGARLRGADLSSADLSGANLPEASLRGANLAEANLSGADLRGADLWNANLSGANLWNANLRGANLPEANLSGARYLTQEQLNSAVGDQGTKIPEGLSQPEHWTR